ncbi:ABC transporter permease [Blastococcus sp. Marseille-P5729]|uniref:ABC transporter permease n=1 Tax=Blastococcus sp. Marseille-P5729 TaxID=2086582 RepID=UPI000D10927E|nr:ABC transporter permease [Blastococcus sp. Marseille-P5729]
MSGLLDDLRRYLPTNVDTILDALQQHLWLSLLPVLIGFAVALPLGYLAHRSRWAYPMLIGAASIFYTIPSLAVFVALPTIIGTSIISPINVVIALSLYTAALLVRTVADGLSAVPTATAQAADAMGYSRLRRLVAVDLPVALPEIFAGLRVATVANVSLVNVGALIGVGGLGALMTDGFRRDYSAPIVVSIVLSVLVALLADLLLVLLQRSLTPWDRARRRSDAAMATVSA